LIGREIFKQRIFDLAVSECAWRLLSPGDHVIDAGANIGYMTMLFAARVGHNGLVHSFEPHPRVRSMLEQNVEQISQTPGAARTIIYPLALGSSPGKAELIETGFFSINEGTAKIASAETIADKVTGYPVELQTLDGMFPDGSFALLKIDVEGFEGEVLRGANALLSSQRVRHVIYEDHTLGQSGLGEILSDYGYTVFSIGHSALGLRLLRGSEGFAEIDASWESASFLATVAPDQVMTLMKSKGWSVLRGT